MAPQNCNSTRIPTTATQLSLGIADFTILKNLGKGEEGIVYKTQRDGNLYTLKVFHAPIPALCKPNLEAYSQRVGKNIAGFFPVKLIYDNYDNDGIVALYYPYIPLYTLFRDPSFFSQEVAQAYLSQFCYSQAYLMREHSLQMVDRGEWMVCRSGYFHYVEYGTTIVKSDDTWCKERGTAAFAFFSVLLLENVFPGVTLGYETPDVTLLRPDFRYDRPFGWVRSNHYSGLIHNCPWTKPIVEKVRDSNAAMFLGPDFYEEIASMLPRKVDKVKWLLAKRSAWAIVNKYM